MNASNGKNGIETERKYLIRRPTDDELSAIPGIEITEIVQTYLKTNENGALRRVRKRGSAKLGYTYTYTEKIHISFGSRIEREREISEEEYLRLLDEADPARRTIEKLRCVFDYKAQLFELDIYPFSAEYASLEIELDDINTPVDLPDHIKLLKDVTGDERYCNSSLAASGRFPDDDGEQ